jgi:hypothetical protein
MDELLSICDFSYRHTGSKIAPLGATSMVDL